MTYAWRLTALLMAGLLTVGTAAGCAKKPGSSQGGNSTVSTESGSDPLAGLAGSLEGKLIVWVGETAEENFKKIAKSFEEATGMTVELVPYTGVSATDKLALDGPAGNGGDVYVQGGGGVLAKAVDQGLFMELPEAAFDLQAFTQSAVDDYRYDGKLYGLPMGSETPALIYNKALIQTIPDTWEALMEECGKYADIPNDKYGLLMDPTNPYFTNALFEAKGGYVFKMNDGVYDTSDIGLNNQGVKDTYRMFKSYFEKGWWQRNAVFATMEKKFEEGKSPVIYDGPWSVANYQKAGIDVGVAPLPKLADGGTPLTYSGSYGVCVSEYTKNPRAAVEFMKYCVTEEAVMDYCRTTGRIPVLDACLELPEIKDDPIKSGFAEQMKNSIPQPNVPEMDQIWSPMLNAGTLIFSQNADIDSTLDQAVERIKEQIALMKS